MTDAVSSIGQTSSTSPRKRCTCPGGSSECLRSDCRVCFNVDFAEELPPCATEDEQLEQQAADLAVAREAKRVAAAKQKPTSRTDPRVNSLRLLFRSLRQFESVYESDGISEIVAPNGVVWSLFDIQYLYNEAMRRPTGVRAFDRHHPTLPLRQQQAIELFLVLNLPEDEAAEIMGLSRTNPVGMYATSGLTKLLKFLDEGRLRRFSPGMEAMLSIA